MGKKEGDEMKLPLNPSGRPCRWTPWKLRGCWLHTIPLLSRTLQPWIQGKFHFIPTSFNSFIHPVIRSYCLSGFVTTTSTPSSFPLSQVCVDDGMDEMSVRLDDGSDISSIMCHLTCGSMEKPKRIWKAMLTLLIAVLEALVCTLSSAPGVWAQIQGLFYINTHRL